MKEEEGELRREGWKGEGRLERGGELTRVRIGDHSHKEHTPKWQSGLTQFNVSI